jgi:PAS domain S-box-containing protein
MFWENWTFRTKIVSVIILTCGFSLSFACGIFFTYELKSYKLNMISDLSSLANVIGGNSASALVFDDNEAANNTLSTLSSENKIVECIIFDKNDNIFAQYRRPGRISTDHWKDRNPALGSQINNHFLSVTSNINWKRETIGKIHLCSDMQLLYDRLKQYAVITVAILVISLITALLAAFKLQRVISDPVLQLTKIARHISDQKDYSARAPDTNRKDELGELLRVFNQMLEHIHERDTALQKAHDSLEVRVQERTKKLRDEISDRQKAEDTLRIEKGKARQYLDIIGGIFVVLDSEGHIVLINRKGCIILGRNEADVIGKEWFQVAIHEKQREKVRSVFHKIMSGETASAEYFENSVVTADGNERLMAWNNTIIRDTSGTSIGTLSAGIDITERRQAEESLRETNIKLEQTLNQLRHAQEQIIRSERLKALGEMASGIAHDFNNALMPMLGYTNYILTDPSVLDSKEDTLSMIQDINMAAKDATEVVRRLREFYKPALSSDRTAMNLNNIIESAMALTRPKWKNDMGIKGTPVEIKLELKDIPAIMVNESQIREVIVNLIINSIDAMPKGGTIILRTREEGRWVVAEIRDTGTGMDTHVLQRCFDPFFSTKGGRGTGLGLSIVHGIIRQHDGWVDIASAPGKGTTVTIRLPCESQVTTKQKEMSSSSTNQQQLEKLKILIVDDEKLNLRLMEKILKANGFLLSSASNGVDALKLFHDETFDIIITDRSMPQMSGDTLAAEIRIINPRIPIIMLTGFADMMEVSNETPPGVDLVVKKPITRESLNDAITNAMSISRKASASPG